MIHNGYSLFDSYLSAQQCRDYLGSIQHYLSENPASEVFRPAKPRALRYKVIDGDSIREHLPEIWDLYVGAIQDLINQSFGAILKPLANQRAGVNVNMMEPNGSEYRWHYDRNLATAILYLNTVDGGETEFYPNYRLIIPGVNSLRVQRVLDRTIHISPVRSILSKKVIVRPAQGRLLIMRGNRCWHSVRAVRAPHERINMIFAYDSPAAHHPMQAALDADLYSDEEHKFKDPNYGV